MKTEGNEIVSEKLNSYFYCASQSKLPKPPSNIKSVTLSQNFPHDERFESKKTSSIMKSQEVTFFFSDHIIDRDRMKI